LKIPAKMRIYNTFILPKKPYGAFGLKGREGGSKVELTQN